jgi:hypothetical protein
VWRSDNCEHHEYEVATPTMRYCERHAGDKRRRHDDENALTRFWRACVEAWPSVADRRLLAWYLESRAGTALGARP